MPKKLAEFCVPKSHHWMKCAFVIFFFSLSCSLRLIDSRYRLLFELYHSANEKRNLNIGKAQKPFTISKMKGFFQIIHLITNSSASENYHVRLVTFATWLIYPIQLLVSSDSHCNALLLEKNKKKNKGGGGLQTKREESLWPTGSLYSSCFRDVGAARPATKVYHT